MKVKKRIALLTVLILILNLFAPYSVLFKNTEIASGKVIAADTEGAGETESPIVFKNNGITEIGGYRVLKVELAIVNVSKTYGGFDINFTIDQTKLKPFDPVYQTEAETFEYAMTENRYSRIHTMTWTNAEYNSGTIRLKGYDATKRDLTNRMYDPSRSANAIIQAASEYNIFFPLAEMNFMVLDDTITADSAPLDMFKLEPIFPSLPTRLYSCVSGYRSSL